MRKPLPRSLNSRIGRQAPARRSATASARRNQQIGVRAAIGSPDAAAQLIELRQAVPVRAIDDDRVRVRNVEPVLDDRRRDEHVELVRDEVDHHALEVRLAHLAVRDRQLRLGHEPRDKIRDRVRSTRRGCGRNRPGRRVRAPCEWRAR